MIILTPSWFLVSKYTLHCQQEAIRAVLLNKLAWCVVVLSL